MGRTACNTALDATANRSAHSRSGSAAWRYDDNDRLLARPGSAGATISCSYDARGNRTEATEGSCITRYTYDSNNRLIQVQDASSKLIARYGYGLLNRRLWKEQYCTISGFAPAHALRTAYLYSDDGLIAEAVQPITVNADQTVSASAAAQTPVIRTQYGPRPDSAFTIGALFIKTLNTNGRTPSPTNTATTWRRQCRRLTRPATSSGRPAMKRLVRPV